MSGYYMQNNNEMGKRTQFLWRPPERILNRVRGLSEEERRSINNQITVLVEERLDQIYRINNHEYENE